MVPRVDGGGGRITLVRMSHVRIPTKRATHWAQSYRAIK